MNSLRSRRRINGSWRAELVTLFLSTRCLSKTLTADNQRLKEEFTTVTEENKRELEQAKYKAQESLEAVLQLKVLQPQLQEVRQ